MMHLNPYKQWVDDIMPAMAIVLVAAALADAVTELDFKPLGECVGILLESIFD
jgi:hypothetical protein